MFRISLINVFGWLFCLLFISELTGQEQKDAYFQQEVVYTINATLDDQRHLLTGNYTLQYTNRSPDTLSFIYFHVWANAYKNRQTAFAKQLLDQGKLSFHFSKEEQRGAMDQLAFTCEGKAVTWSATEKHIDILKINLPEPLLPGASTTIQTPFRLQIPDNFSRLAHQEQSYYLCQWYPKPAVYDLEGWHPMPYLDYGEYYGEFGRFEVTLTLPANYVVGATGVLQTPSEQQFLDSLAAAHQGTNWKDLLPFDEDNPSSSTHLKTIRYTAERVHDFAWFADKRFFVQQQTLQLPSGEEIDNLVLFKPEGAYLWGDSALVYAKRAVHHYSNIVGAYPYPSLTLVQGDYKGTDMEYPMITVVSSGIAPFWLDNVIAHEIGHNWFYGILGSNEREYAWMDEGINTYLDNRYMRTYYRHNYRDAEYESYFYEASRRTDQPIQHPSDSFAYDNYYLCAYAKPTLSFLYLEQYLGRPVLDDLLKRYYEQWKFKHPQPDDLRAIFEAHSTKPVDWFFDHIITTTDYLDYAATGHHCCNKHNQATISIQNKGEFTAPILVSALTETDSVVAKQWVEGLAVGQDTSLELPVAARYQIDEEGVMPELNRNNNVVRSKGLFKRGRPLKLGVLPNYLRLDHPWMYLLPILGYNHYDGLQIGAVAYSLPLPRWPWQYAVLPMGTTGTRSVTGLGDLRHHHHFGGHHLLLGGRVKSFHKRRQDYSEERPYSFKERYYKFTAFAEWDWAPKYLASPHRHTTGWSSALIGEEHGQEHIDDQGNFQFDGKTTTWRSTHRLYHTYHNRKNPSPFSIKTQLEYAHYERFKETKQYLQLTLEANARFLYRPRWGLDFRGFAGAFLWHTDRQFGAFPLVLTSGNRQDYHYDQLLLGRREQENVLAQQVVMNQGGFKVPLENVQFLGASNSFLVAFNLKADLPIVLPFRLDWLQLKPFVDLGYALPTDPISQGQDWSESTWVSAGLMLELGDGLANIYFPILETENLGRQVRSFTKGQWYRRITVGLNFNELYTEKTLKKSVY